MSTRKCQLEEFCSPRLQDQLSVKYVNGTTFLKQQGARVTNAHQRGLNIAAKETKW